MRREEEREIIAELPSTGQPFTVESIQNLINTISTDVAQTIAQGLGGALVVNVVSKLFTVTSAQKQKLQQVQSNPGTVAQIVQMCGATGVLQQDVANTLKWIFNQLG